MKNVIQFTSNFLVLLVLAPALANASDDTARQTDGKSSAALSVAPSDYIEYPLDRPDWVQEAPVLEGDTHTWTVVAGPSDTPEECSELLKVLRQAAVASYIDQLTGAGGRLDFYPINDDWIEKELITNRYSGEVTQGETTLYEQAVELEFSPQTQQRILAAWRNVEVRDRLGALGVLMFAGIMCLIFSSTVFSGWCRRIERRALPG